MGIEEVSLMPSYGQSKSLPTVITAQIDNDALLTFDADEKTDIVIKGSKTEIDADCREKGADVQRLIGQHLRSKAQDKVCNSAIVANVGAGVAGVGGVLAGVAYVAGAPITVPVTLGVAALAGLGTGIYGLAKTNVASREKTKANNLVRQSQHTIPETSKDVVDKASSYVEALAHHACGDNPYAKVSSEEIAGSIKELDLPKKQKIVYLQKPNEDKTKNSKAVVYYTEIDQSEYDNVPDKNGDLKGVKTTPPVEIDREYYDSGMLSEFLKKSKLTETEKIRFLEVAQALSTNKKYKTKPQDRYNPGAYQKEDTDFFDFNSDGKINATDLKILHNLLYKKYDKSKVIINPDVKSLNTVAVDFNNDGVVDEKDEKIYQSALSKSDINVDGSLNLTDKTILIKYLKSRIMQANRTGQEHNALLSSFGYKINEEEIQNEEFFLTELKYNVMKLEQENK